MAPDDSPELDPKLQEMVQKAVEEVRGEFLRKLQETRDRLEGLVRGDEPEAEATEDESEAAEGDAESESQDLEAIEEKEVAPPPGFTALLAAVPALARSRSQTEILTSLLEAASGPHSRAALFLTRPEGLWGWAGRGGYQGVSRAPRQRAAGRALPSGLGAEGEGGRRLGDARRRASLQLAGGNEVRPRGRRADHGRGGIASAVLFQSAGYVEP